MVEISESVYYDVLEQAAEQARQLREFQDALDEVEGKAESDDGLVSVTVGARGELTALDLDPRIYRRPDSTALAESIVDTIAKARKDADEKGVAVADRIVPGFHDENDTDPDFDPVLRELDRRAQGKGTR